MRVCLKSMARKLQTPCTITNGGLDEDLWRAQRSACLLSTNCHTRVTKGDRDDEAAPSRAQILAGQSFCPLSVTAAASGVKVGRRPVRHHG